MHRAKRLSCRLSERASVFWAGHGAALSSCSEDSDPPPPVPRHRTQDTSTAGQQLCSYLRRTVNESSKSSTLVGRRLQAEKL